MKKGLVVIAWLALLPRPGAGESLADVAKREQERRQKVGEAGVKPFVFNQDNVEARSAKADAAGAETGDKAPAAPAAEAKLDALTPAATGASDALEQEWRARARPLRERLDAARAELASTPRYLPRVESKRIDGGRQNAMTPDVPNPAYASAERRLKDAEKAMSDLEDEARRARILPGWLR